MTIKTRDTYFDNLRGFLILCVILGNSLEYIYPTAINPHYLILVLYMFHMPLFTFISGYFCKKSRRKTQEKVIDTIKIYLCAQIFYYFFNKFILNRNLTFQLLYPSWTLWYLLALIVWYIASDYIKDFKKSLIISVILSLLIGFDNSTGTYASVSRIFFFMPFFIAGLYFDKEMFMEKYKNHAILNSIIVSSILILLFLIRNHTDIELFFEYSSYTFYYDNALYPFLMRIFHYIGALFIGSFILYYFPSKKTCLSWIGHNSLILYISHAAIIQLLVKVPINILNYDNWNHLIFSESIIILIIICATIGYSKLKLSIKSCKYKLNSNEIINV